MWIADRGTYLKIVREEKAGDGSRTHIASLEGWCFTTKLHPHVICYLLLGIYYLLSNYKCWNINNQ